jgi:thiamine biosynthesis lipoprotein
VYALGKKANQNWKVGVRNPRGDGIIGIAAVSNLAVVTSGDYERYFFGPDSVRYCHIIDPKTGWPAHTGPAGSAGSAGMASTTVIMRDPLSAQGWSKVLFVLGPDAIALSDVAGGFEALLITDGMKAHLSKGMVGAMKLDLAGTGIEPAAGR